MSFPCWGWPSHVHAVAPPWCPAILPSAPGRPETAPTPVPHPQSEVTICIPTAPLELDSPLLRGLAEGPPPRVPTSSPIKLVCSTSCSLVGTLGFSVRVFIFSSRCEVPGTVTTTGDTEINRRCLLVGPAYSRESPPVDKSVSFSVKPKQA